MLAIKGNQKLFYEEVKMFLDDEKMEDIKKRGTCYHKTVEKEHGGISTREYYITDETEWFTEKGKWKQLNTFGKVRRTLEKKNGKITVEDRYYMQHRNRCVTVHKGGKRTLGSGKQLTLDDGLCIS